MPSPDSLPIGLNADQLQTALCMSDPESALAQTIDAAPAVSTVGQIRDAGNALKSLSHPHQDLIVQAFIAGARNLRSASRALAQRILEIRNVRENSRNVASVFGDVIGVLTGLRAVLIQITREHLRTIPRKALGIDREYFCANVYGKPDAEQVGLLETLIEEAQTDTLAGDVRNLLATAIIQKGEIEISEMYGPSAHWIKMAKTKGPSKAIAEYVIGRPYKAAVNNGHAYVILFSTLQGMFDILSLD